MGRASVRHVLRLARAVVALAAFGSISVANADGWTDWGEVGELVQGYPGADAGEMVFFVASVTFNPAQCNNPPTGFYFPVTGPREQRMFALLTAAKMAGKRVQVYVSTQTGSCHQWHQAKALGLVVE